ncbi:MAG: hypothetical protein V4623_05235 [Pseudomonadota bacterium]
MTFSKVFPAESIPACTARWLDLGFDPVFPSVPDSRALTHEQSQFIEPLRAWLSTVTSNLTGLTQAGLETELSSVPLTDEQTQDVLNALASPLAFSPEAFSQRIQAGWLSDAYACLAASEVFAPNQNQSRALEASIVTEARNLLDEPAAPGVMALLAGLQISQQEQLSGALLAKLRPHLHQFIETAVTTLCTASFAHEVALDTAAQRLAAIIAPLLGALTGTEDNQLLGTQLFCDCMSKLAAEPRKQQALFRQLLNHSALTHHGVSCFEVLRQPEQAHLRGALQALCDAYADAHPAHFFVPKRLSYCLFPSYTFTRTKLLKMPKAYPQNEPQLQKDFSAHTEASKNFDHIEGLSIDNSGTSITAYFPAHLTLLRRCLETPEFQQLVPVFIRAGRMVRSIPVLDAATIINMRISQINPNNLRNMLRNLQASRPLPAVSRLDEGA